MYKKRGKSERREAAIAARVAAPSTKQPTPVYHVAFYRESGKDYVIWGCYVSGGDHGIVMPVRRQQSSTKAKYESFAETTFFPFSIESQ